MPVCASWKTAHAIADRACETSFLVPKELSGAAENRYQKWEGLRKRIVADGCLSPYLISRPHAELTKRGTNACCERSGNLTLDSLSG